MKSTSLRDKAFKIIDAIITAPVHAQASAGQNARLLVQSGGSNYKKMGAFINLLDCFIPGIGRKASLYFLRSKKLALAEGRLTLLDFGSGATVLRYENASGDYVVKISRKSLGKPAVTLLQFSREYQESYSKLVAWYNQKYPIVPSSHFFISQSTFLDTPCIVCVQDFVDGEQEDLLRDYDDEQIVQMMKRDRRLGDEFMEFIRGTLQAVESEGLCLDMLGRKNLMLLTRDKVKQLVIVDLGVFNLDTLARDMPEKLKLVQDDVQRLKMLGQRIVGG